MNGNFKRFVKLAAFSLAVMLSLTACAAGGGNPPSSGTPASGTPAAPDAISSQEEKTYEDVREISLAVLDNVTEKEWENDFHQYFMDKFKIKWDYNYVEWSSWQEKLRIWINAGDLPDVSIWDYNYTDAVNYAEQELLYRFPDDWKERWPNAAKAYSSSPLNLELEERFGGTYLMLRPIYVYNQPSDPIMNQIGVIALRKDWAKEVNFELKDAYTVDEMMEYGRLIKEKDPGKIGANLIPLCFDPANSLTSFVSASANHARSETAFYKDTGGTYKWGPSEQETLEGLKLYQKAYRDGLMDPEFYLMNDDDKDKFYINGTAALYAMSGIANYRQDADTEMRNNLNLNSDDVIHEAIVLGNDEKYHNVVLGANYWSSLIFSPEISKENFERMMDMIEFTCTKEGQMIVNMGFEGVDWEYGANKEPASILPEGTTLLDKYGTKIESIYILSDDFSMINPAIKKEYRDRMMDLAQLKADKGAGEYSDFDMAMQLYTSKSKNQAQLDYAQEYANLILQEGDLEANWKKWAESKLPLIQPYLDELNAME